MKPVRDRLTYANIVATLALFIALGGSSYAVVSISGGQIKNRSVPAKKLKLNSIGGREVKESRLGTVRRARNAAKVGGITADQLLLACPRGMLPAAAACVETKPRPAASYGNASGTCSNVDNVRPARILGRRLPTYEELAAALTYREITLAPGGELTSSVLASGNQLQVTLITGEAGSVTQIPDDGNVPKPYRCAVVPRN